MFSLQSHSYSLLTPKVFGSVMGSIVLETLTKEWYDAGQKAFVLYHSPTPVDKYRRGNSWLEKTGMSKEDIRYGLGYVATRVPNEKELHTLLVDIRPYFDTSGLLLNSNHLIGYWKAPEKNSCYYALNVELIDSVLTLITTGEWRDYVTSPRQRAETPAHKRPLTDEEAREISSFAGYSIPALGT